MPTHFSEPILCFWPFPQHKLTSSQLQTAVSVVCVRSVVQMPDEGAPASESSEKSFSKNLILTAFVFVFTLHK